MSRFTIILNNLQYCRIKRYKCLLDTFINGTNNIEVKLDFYKTETSKTYDCYVYVGGHYLLSLSEVESYEVCNIKGVE